MWTWMKVAQQRALCWRLRKRYMAYKVIRSETSDRDREAIFDFLFEAAFERGSSRILEIENATEALGDGAHPGTLQPDIFDGLRRATKGCAIFYFDVDDTMRLIRVLAVFFGG